MVNLFVLVILREFNEHFYNTDNPLNQYSEDLNVFKDNWNQVSGGYEGRKINQRNIIQFFIMLP